MPSLGESAAAHNVVFDDRIKSLKVGGESF